MNRHANGLIHGWKLVMIYALSEIRTIFAVGQVHHVVGYSRQGIVLYVVEDSAVDGGTVWDITFE